MRAAATFEIRFYWVVEAEQPEAQDLNEHDQIPSLCIDKGALGVAGSTSSVDTAVDALKVAAVADVAEAVVTARALSRASSVRIQIDGSSQIRMLTVQ